MLKMHKYGIWGITGTFSVEIKTKALECKTGIEGFKKLN